MRIGQTVVALECWITGVRKSVLFATGIGIVLVAGVWLQPLASGVRADAAQTAEVEPGEALPGGKATTPRSSINRDAFSQPSGGLSFEGEMNFRIGNSLFRRLWVSSPASTDSSDGLGPLYNARGCQNCHLKDGRGHPPAAKWPDDDAVSMLMRLSVPALTSDQKALLHSRKANVIGHPAYGTQLQDFAIQGQKAEGRFNIDYHDKPVRFADGTSVTLRRPIYTLLDLAFGDLGPDAMISPRVAPQMIGLGLLEAIPEADIRAGADPEDHDQDGISGRANEVWSLETDKVALGRFGWKAASPSVKEQSASAFLADIGLSTPLFPNHAGECTKAQSDCLKAPHGASERHDGAEIGHEFLNLVVFYAQNLAVPPRRRHDAPNVLRGKKLFHETGCAVCHRPHWTTGTLPGQPHLSGQLIWPYTDMLLHDMGPGLADDRPEGMANGREWRTPPLWGIGLTQAVSRHTFFLHDGRARNLEEAILWHGGEAKASQHQYRKLSKTDREALIAFLESL